MQGGRVSAHAPPHHSRAQIATAAAAIDDPGVKAALAPAATPPTAWDAAALHAYATALGYTTPRAEVPLLLGACAHHAQPAQAPRALLHPLPSSLRYAADFVVSELQGARLVLSDQHTAKEAVRPVVATLPGELQLLAKRLSIPVSEEAAKGAPERVLTQIKAKARPQQQGGGRGWWWWWQVDMRACRRRPQVSKIVATLPPAALADSTPLLDASHATAAVLVSSPRLSGGGGGGGPSLHLRRRW
jgi:hypothetical protein